MLEHYLPRAINTGPWITAYTLDVLRALPDTTLTLPICSIATSYAECARLDGMLLPPLYHEAMNPALKQALVERIVYCFPVFGEPERNRERLRVVELPRMPLPESASPQVIAFSVDTAVEEHGPHLPLATDTIQSYGVLRALADRHDFIELGRPLDYGQLTWGLPFGFSIDVTADLLTGYVAGYVHALAAWKRPQFLYVVDVHGSAVHRDAIVRGLQASDHERWSFRWLHEPLVEFASQRGDQHAGGVETALVERIDPALVDPQWWPARIDELADGQMPFQKAVELSSNLTTFADYVQRHGANGIVGDIRNYRSLDAEALFDRMLAMAQSDIDQLLGGHSARSAGKKLW